MPGKSIRIIAVSAMLFAAIAAASAQTPSAPPTENVTVTGTKERAALEGYLAMSGALAKGSITPAVAERIALAVAEVDGCDYCLSAHTYLARNLAKLDDAEITANRSGASNDPKTDAAIRFAAKVARERGHVGEEDLKAAKTAGWSDARLVEIVQHVALNFWTNTFNEVFKTDIDFPVVTARKTV